VDWDQKASATDERASATDEKASAIFHTKKSKMPPNFLQKALFFEVLVPKILART
jgi:hypothetical protein